MFRFGERFNTTAYSFVVLFIAEKAVTYYYHYVLLYTSPRVPQKFLGTNDTDIFQID